MRKFALLLGLCLGLPWTGPARSAPGHVDRVIDAGELRVLLLVDNPQARDLEVQSGRADLFMTDFPCSQSMIETGDWARVVSPPSVFHGPQRACSTQAGAVHWQTRVDQFVAAIKRQGRLLGSACIHKLNLLVAVV